MTSFSIQTFGCRVNQAEAFLWADEFQKHGLKYEEDFCHSDLVIVNSCTLTSRADSDLKGFIRRATSLNPKAKLVVTGCYAERAAEEVRKIPQVWLVFSNKEKEDLPRKILSFWPREQRKCFTFPLAGPGQDSGWMQFPLHFLHHPQRQGKGRELGEEKNSGSSQGIQRPGV